MEPIVARKTWRTLEPVHGMIYFAPQATKAYAALGVTSSRMGYFASRVAPMGAVPAEVVISTFFNFYPGLVRRSIPAAWDITTPAAMVEARLAGADEALRHAFSDEILDSKDLAEAAELARRAAEAAAARPEGRPLFAGHASLAWPDEPHLVLWHAQSLLREFRGDAHIAAMTVEGLRGLDALIVHGATGDVPLSVLKLSRAWPDDDWGAGIEALRARGWVEGGDESLTLTGAGRAHRQWVEDRTDQCSVVAYEAIGEAGCERLRELGRPLSKAVIDAGLLNVDAARFLES